MRELLDEARESDDRRARLAVEIFCYRVRSISALTWPRSAGGRAGLYGRHRRELAGGSRARLRGQGGGGLELDPARNEAHTHRREGLISADGSRLAVYVIPTDEELLIARDTVRSIQGIPQRF